jgi:predicted transcriptional regulator YdeE
MSSSNQDKNLKNQKSLNENENLFNEKQKLNNNNNNNNNNNDLENDLNEINLDELRSLKYKMSVLIKPELKLVGVSSIVNTSSLKIEKPEDSPLYKAASQYHKLITSVPNRMNGTISFSVYRDYKTKWWGLRGMEFKYFIGQQVMYFPKNLPEGLECMAIPAGKFAAFTAQGKLPKVSENLWKLTMTMSDEQLGGKRTKIDYEEYDAMKMQNTNNATVQLFIGIE